MTKRHRHYPVGAVRYGEAYSASPVGSKGMDFTVYSDTNAHYLGLDASTDTLTFIGTTFALTAAFNITGNVGITGTLSCSGDFKVNTDDFVVDVDGDITLAPTGGDVDITGTLDVSSDFRVNTDDFVVDADGDITLAPTGGDVDITGTLSATGNFDINTTKFTVNATSADLTSYNQEADATGVTWTAKKSRASGAACVDNDVALTIVAQGMNDNATPALHDLASIDFVMTDNASASEDGHLSFKTVVAGAALAEKLKIDGTGLVIPAAVTRGIVIGTDANVAGSGVALSAANFQASGIYADDGGVALTTSYTEALTSRYLVATAVTGGAAADVSAAAFHGDMHVRANYTGMGGMSGVWGAFSTISGVTVDNSASSMADMAGGHFSVDVPSGATLAASSRAAGVSVGGNLGGTLTGTVSGLRVRAPSAGNWTYGIDLSGMGTPTADIRLLNGETIDNLTDGLITFSNCLKATPNRISGDYAYGVEIDGDELFFIGGAGTKSNLVDISGERPSGTTPTGDSYDSVLKIAGTNYADSSGYIMRGLNGKVSNGNGGSMQLIEHNLSVNGKSGSTTLTVRGMTLTAENYGTCATEFGGLDIVLKNEAAVATTEYGLRIRNLNNSIADAVAAAVLVSDTGANTGWDYVIDDNGASVVVADMRLHNAATVNNSAAGSVDVALGTLAGATADDGLAITVTDSTTFASGYANMLHVIANSTGNKTGNTSVSQWNGIAADITMAGTGNVNGGYVYVCKSGTPDLSTYTVTGWNVDVQEMGATDYLNALWLQKTNTTKGTAVDSFILCSLQGAGVAKSGIHFQGIALPDYFLTIPGSARDMLVDAEPTGTTKHYLKVNLNGVDCAIICNSVA